MGDFKKPLTVFVAARQEVLDGIVRLLEGLSGFTVSGTATDGEQCIEGLLKAPAEMALIDFSLPKISGVKVVEYVSTKRPSLICVILAEQANPHYFRSAMLAGAREFIILPVERGDLQFSLDRVAQVAAERSRSAREEVRYDPSGRGRDPRVLAVAGAKGGVGASFIAANLAVDLSAADVHATALVDFNLRASDLATIINIEPRKTLNDLGMVMSDLEPALLKTISLPVEKNLDLYAAPLEAGPAQALSSDQVRLLIECFRQMYDLTIVDVGTYVDAATETLLEMADIVLIISTPEVISVRNGRRLVDRLESLGISKTNIMCVINRFESLSLAPERISEHLGIAALGSLGDSSEVKALLDEGRLIGSSRDAGLIEAFGKITASLKNLVSLPEGQGVH